MSTKLYLIRHGMTKGNMEKRYVGRTDESLCPEGIEKLKKLCTIMPEAGSGILYISSMKRCRETARILFPKAQQRVIPDFQECDFGDFEYCSYRELNGNPDYQRFIDSGGRTGFPGGETPQQFRRRIIHAFDGFVDGLGMPGPRQAIIVCHGGCIMAVLDCYAVPHRDYFSWQTECGGGYIMELDTVRWAAGSRCLRQVQSLNTGNKGELS